MITSLTALTAATAAVPDPERDVIWLVESDAPALSSVDLASRTLTRHADLAAVPSGVALSKDGMTVLVACADGTVVTVAADDPGAGPTTLAQRPGEVFGQMAATRPATGPGSALVISSPPSRALAIGLADGQTRPVATLPDLTGVTASARHVWAATTTGGIGQLSELRAGAAQGLADNLLPTGHVTNTPDEARLLVAHPVADRVSVLTLATGAVEIFATDGLPGDIVELHGLADGRFVLLTTGGIALADALADLEVRPKLVAPAAPLFVNSWIPLQYDLSGTGLTEDQIEFVVADGPDVAIVSHTTFQAGVGGQKLPLLVAGGLLGTFRLDLVKKGSGDVLDSVSFDVTDHWHDPDTGPSQFYAGDNSAPPAGDWGGGPGSPQNMNTRPHNGAWRLAILMVNTADGAYPTAAAPLAAARKAMLDEVQDGVSFNGATRSARHYYEELSGWNPATNRGITIRAHNNEVFGPVNLPSGWGTYFAQKLDDAGAVSDKRWTSKGATVPTIVTQAITQGVLSTGDFSNIDVLLIVPFSPDTVAGTATDRFVWPHAHDAMTFLAGTNVQKDQRSFGYIFAPPDFDVHDGRRMHATLSHELGHTLGLPDLYSFPSYTQDIVDRLVPGWDMMGGSRNDMPHYSLSNRMRQGWVQAGHLRLFNFQGQPNPTVDQNVTLHAAELGAPPQGRVRGIEIRLADGWNTYVEYRAKQASQLGDTLPNDRRVVVTDVTSETFTAPVSRPPILFVHNDDDGDGPILDTNADYEDKDPGTEKDLVVKVISTAADNAVVNVKYGSGGRPDPGIQPWNGGPKWQSADIEVRNARAQADPQWFNTPWLDNMNTVVAKVHNNGDRLAKGVVVDIFVLEYTTGDGPLARLGRQRRTSQPERRWSSPPRGRRRRPTRTCASWSGSGSTWTPTSPGSSRRTSTTMRPAATTPSSCRPAPRRRPASAPKSGSPIRSTPARA